MTDKQEQLIRVLIEKTKSGQIRWQICEDDSAWTGIKAIKYNCPINEDIVCFTYISESESKNNIKFSNCWLHLLSRNKLNGFNIQFGDTIENRKIGHNLIKALHLEIENKLDVARIQREKKEALDKIIDNAICEIDKISLLDNRRK